MIVRRDADTIASAASRIALTQHDCHGSLRLSATRTLVSNGRLETASDDIKILNLLF